MAAHPLQLAVILDLPMINARYAIDNGTPREVVFKRSIDRGAQPETESKL
jgi:hypothetical protein